MDNPYAAPRAPLGNDPVVGSDAIAELSASRTHLQALMAVSLVAALIRVFPLLAYYFFASQQMALMTPAALPVVAALALGFMLWRTGQTFALLRSDQSMAAVTYTVRVLGQLGLTVALSLVLPTVLSLLFYAAVAVVGIVERDLSDAAKHLRTMTFAVLAAGAFSAIARVGSMITMIGYVTSGGVFGVYQLSSLLQVGLSVVIGWTLWSQLPVLNAVIANPSAETLRAWAASQRLLWRRSAWTGVGFVVIELLGTAALLGLGI